AATRHVVDLGDAAAVGAYVDALAPDLVVNAAAYTAVDRAEDEPDAAFAINRDAVAALAQAARKRGALLIHFST
ncbi:sugar nucleotide-binding protein, partial [Escherichia coli]|uniref:sugar nucleotide-binding protein n=4 Tax=Pseudomonadota TaxID=1224 RepID=UPI0016566828